MLLTLFYGLAVCGFTLLPAGRARTRWMVMGGLAAALSVAYLPSHVSRLDQLDRGSASTGRSTASSSAWATRSV